MQWFPGLTFQEVKDLTNFERNVLVSYINETARKEKMQSNQIKMRNGRR